MAPKRRMDDGDGDDLAPAHKASRDNGLDSSQRKAKFKAHLTALNSQFAEWVQSQKGSHSSELWTPGVRDYLDHAEQLLKEFKDVIDAEKQACALPAAATQAFSHVNGPFGASTGLSSSAPPAFSLNGGAPAAGGAADKSKDTTEPAKPSLGFNFGGPAAPAPTPASTVATSTSAAPANGGFFGFGAAAAPAPASAASTSSFSAGSAAATTSGMFSFGQGTTNLPAPSFGTAGGFGSFKFGSYPRVHAPVPAAAAGDGGAPPPFAGGPAAGSTGGEEDEAEEPQKYESTVEANEEAGQVHYKSKAKFMHLKGKEWDTKGVGLLCVRTPKDDPTKPFITFTTEAGRVLYCANVFKSMKVIVNEAKNAVTWGAVWSPDSSTPPSLQSVMAMLPKGKSPELRDAIEQAQAKIP